MVCLSSFGVDPVTLPVALIWLSAALILFWIGRYHRFDGKTDFVISFLAMLWWLLAVGLEISAQGMECKLLWSRLAWPAIALLPIAWSFFVFCYIRGSGWVGERFRRAALIGIPVVIAVLALSNPWHQLLLGAGTVLRPGTNRIAYDHGPLFYVFALLLYPFVCAALGLLALSFREAAPNIWPFLATLILVTLAPFVANAAFVFGGVTIFDFDPTAFMFTFAMIGFSWLLANNRMMDTAALGRDVLFFASSEPVIVIDAEHRILGANDAAKRSLFSTPPARGDDLAAAHEAVRSLVGSLGQSGAAPGREPVQIGQRIFDPRPIEISGPIRPTRRRLGWSITFVDITEREMSAQALQQALSEAQAANRAKSDFLAVVSHELRTPMTSLKGGVDLLLGGKCGDLTFEMHKTLEIVQRNGARLSRLIEMILDIQKLEQDTLRLEYAEADLAALLDEVLLENRAFAERMNVVLKRVGSGCGRTVHVDAFRLRQVIDNILSNAIKFSEPGGVVEGSVETFDDRVRLSIRDQGSGIPAGSEELVFGRFSQVDGSSTRNAEGSGLGMHISRSLIDKLGGRLSYDSALGVGTVFHVDLPLAPRARAAGSSA